MPFSCSIVFLCGKFDGVNLQNSRNYIVLHTTKNQCIMLWFHYFSSLIGIMLIRILSVLLTKKIKQFFPLRIFKYLQNQIGQCWLLCKWKYVKSGAQNVTILIFYGNLPVKFTCKRFLRFETKENNNCFITKDWLLSFSNKTLWP